MSNTPEIRYMASTSCAMIYAARGISQLQTGSAPDAEYGTGLDRFQATYHRAGAEGLHILTARAVDLSLRSGPVFGHHLPPDGQRHRLLDDGDGLA